MICPCEKKGETSVVDSRPTEDGTAIRRRRMCECGERFTTCLLYTSPSPRDAHESRMPSSA